MKQSLAIRSAILLGFSVCMLILVTFFESALVGISLSAERIMTFLLLVLPAVVGAVLGVVSLVRREGQTGLAMTGAVLNTLFALFHLILILFAG